MLGNNSLKIEFSKTSLFLKILSKEAYNHRDSLPKWPSIFSL